MAIWSLTSERVEKLRMQIGDKEAEVNALTQLSAKDIWNVDLDAFVAEWDTQLDEESKRKKKIANMTRRASHKLGIGAGKGGKKKKRKAGDSDSDDDSGSDFGPVKKKAKPKKEGLLGYLRQDAEAVKKPSAAEALKSSSAFGSTAPSKQGTLLSHLVKKESTPQTDGTSDDVHATEEPAPAPKRGRQPASKATKKAAPVVLSDDESDIFAAVAEEVAKQPAKTITTSRTARGATKQAPKYNQDSDSDSDGDDMLGDVSSMVKTIGSSNGKPLFKSSASARPSSSTGASKAVKKSTPIELDDDETNYEGLMPQPSPKRPAPRNVNDTIMSSDDDDIGFTTKKSAAATKLTAKPKLAASKPVPKPKASSAVAAKKPTPLSPAAKAYAAKLAKTQSALPKPTAKAKKPITIDSDEDMDDADALANDILSDEDDEPTPKPASRAPAARPGRRAAAKPAKYAISDDDDMDSDNASEPDFDDDDSD